MKLVPEQQQQQQQQQPQFFPAGGMQQQQQQRQQQQRFPAPTFQPQQPFAQPRMSSQAFPQPGNFHTAGPMMPSAPQYNPHQALPATTTATQPQKPTSTDATPSQLYVLQADGTLIPIQFNGTANDARVSNTANNGNGSQQPATAPTLPTQPMAGIPAMIAQAQRNVLKSVVASLQSANGGNGRNIGVKASDVAMQLAAELSLSYQDAEVIVNAESSSATSLLRHSHSGRIVFRTSQDLVEGMKRVGAPEMPTAPVPSHNEHPAFTNRDVSLCPEPVANNNNNNNNNVEQQAPAMDLRGVSTMKSASATPATATLASPPAAYTPCHAPSHPLAGKLPLVAAHLLKMQDAAGGGGRNIGVKRQDFVQSFIEANPQVSSFAEALVTYALAEGALFKLSGSRRLVFVEAPDVVRSRLYGADSVASSSLCSTPDAGRSLTAPPVINSIPLPTLDNTRSVFHGDVLARSRAGSSTTSPGATDVIGDSWTSELGQAMHSLSLGSHTVATPQRIPSIRNSPFAAASDDESGSSVEQEQAESTVAAVLANFEF